MSSTVFLLCPASIIEFYISYNIFWYCPPFNPNRTVTARTGQSIAILEWAVSLEIKPKVNLLFLLAGVCCDGGRWDLVCAPIFTCAYNIYICDVCVEYLYLKYIYISICCFIYMLYVIMYIYLTKIYTFISVCFFVFVFFYKFYMFK